MKRLETLGRVQSIKQTIDEINSSWERDRTARETSDILQDLRRRSSNDALGKQRDSSDVVRISCKAISIAILSCLSPSCPFFLSFSSYVPSFFFCYVRQPIKFFSSFRVSSVASPISLIIRFICAFFRYCEISVSITRRDHLL